MKSKHIPIRKCMGCGGKKPKKDFIRIVFSDEKQPLVDKTYKINKRGIYVCKDVECLKKARKSRRLERTFSCKISEEFYNELEGMIC